MSDPEVPQGEMLICVVAMPRDTNPNGDIFGGWLVSHMDMGGGVAGRRRAQSRVVTVAIDAMVFLKPIAVGDVVGIYAALLQVGHTSMRFNIQAWTLSVSDQNHKKVAEGIFTFVAISDNGRPHLVDRCSKLSE